MNLEIRKEIENYQDLPRKERMQIQKELQKKYNDKSIKVYSRKYLSSKPSVTREELRDLKEHTNVLEELMLIIHQYFPFLRDRFNELTDCRNQSYTTYDLDICLLTRLLALCSGIQSMKGITRGFNTQHTIDNINRILHTNYQELPHHDTLDDIFKKLSYEELEKIQTSMIKTLIRAKILDKYRFNATQFLVVIDGTMLFSTAIDLGHHAITKTHNSGKDNEHTTYGYYVLEAKLVCGDMVFSLASEFIENSKMDTDSEKQDCELKAAYRLLATIRKRFPKLPMIVGGDALYASKKFMDYCSHLSFDYLIRYKEGAMSTIAEEFNHIQTTTIENYEFVNDLGYGSGTKASEGTTNVIRYIELDTDTADTTEFTFITSLLITKNNREDIVLFGRRRWKIENQGFKDQKKGVLNIEHITSKDFNTIRNHYLFIQFAHMLLTLLNYGNVAIKALRETKKGVSALLKDTLTHFIPQLNLNRAIQLRLP